MVLKIKAKATKIKDGINVKFPKLEIKKDTSGFGKAKENPFRIDVDGKAHRYFKTEKSAVNAYKKIKQKLLKEKNQIFKKY
jgi:hypothetical protein